MHEQSPVRCRLVAAAKAEFLHCGYQKASLRSIAQQAGATTGAIYFFFNSKEGLFHAVVDETAADIRAMLMRGTELEYSGEVSGMENERSFILCLHHHPEEAIILLEKAEGSPLEGFRKDMTDLLEESFFRFFVRLGGRDADRPLLRLLVEQRVHGVLSLIARRFDLETTLRYAVLLGVHSDAGLEGMMQHYHQFKKGSAG